MSASRSSERVAAFCIGRRGPVLGVITALTLILLFFARQQQARTVFADLLPRDHPYISTHEQFKESFGGSNIVSIMVKSREGDIFQRPVLEAVRRVTRDLREVTGVNQFQIISLASNKLKQVHASTYGIESKPLMWPDLPETPEQMSRLRDAVLTNPLVYGSYVSFDLTAALITVDFFDHLMDYGKVFAEIESIVRQASGPAVEVSAVGEPILQGWVQRHLPRSLGLFVLSFLALGAILWLFFMRSWRGTLIPLLNAVVTAIWALGLARLLGLNFDPLAVVIAFLITARVTSHCVQAVIRFDTMVFQEGYASSRAAAQASLAELWKPGLLGVITDAGGILVVALAPIPLLQKSAVIGAIWVGCIIVTGVVLTPVLLSFLPLPRQTAHRLDFNRVLDASLAFYGRLATGPARGLIVWGSAIVLLLAGTVATRITIGDAHPGSPLLWPDSAYNRAMSDINQGFLGTDRMFVVVSADEDGALKQPSVLQQMAGYQRYVELQPEVGGSVSLADLIPSVNRVLNEGNPRYQELGADAAANGELLYMYLAGADPDDLDRFVDQPYRNASVTLFLRDHRGSTIRTLVERTKAFAASEPLDSVEIRLAGGMAGVLAAVNEVIFAGQVESIALALLVVLVTCSVGYRSGVAGIFFMVPILLSNTVTFAFMVVAGIGLNISNLPVAALGIGLGVDYALYVVDGIRQNHGRLGDLDEAIRVTYGTAGRGVATTALPLIACTALWYFFSPLRFQAEMAILIALWMAVSALSALLVMPALVRVLRPRFVLGPQRAA